MQLTDYLRAQRLTFAGFARLIGTRHARTVERYAKGQSIPNRRMMSRVVEATNGAVTPADFYSVQPAGRPAEEA